MQSVAEKSKLGRTLSNRMLSALAIGSLALPVGTAADEPTAGSPPAVVELSVGTAWPIEHPTRHVQGLCVNDEWFWISSVDKQAKAGWVFRVERRSLRVVAERKLADGARYHPGGMQWRQGELWVPLAEYRPHSTSSVLRLDAMSLETRGEFNVDDHLGAVAAAEDGTLLAANWDARQVYVFTPDGKLLRRVDSPTGVAYQDWEWHGDALYATGQTTIDGAKTAVIDLLDGQSLALRKRYLLRGQVRSGGSNFGREGLSYFLGKFYLLPEDGPRTTVYEFLPPGAIPRAGSP